MIVGILAIIVWLQLIIFFRSARIKPLKSRNAFADLARKEPLCLAASLAESTIGQQVDELSRWRAET
jgi:hypothetical protein